MCLLGEMLEKKGDFKGAADLYKMAVDQDHPRAMFNLARLTQEGKGTEKNKNEAFRLLCTAAAAGDPAAKMLLAKIRDVTKQQQKH